MPIYMKYASIDGKSTTVGFVKWIEVNSFQAGAGRGIASARGAETNREASEPSISEITITKEWDAESSSKLFQESVAGKLNNKVEFKFTTVEGSKQQTFLHITLKNTGISGYSISSGGERPSESISLNFSHIEIVPYVKDAALGSTPGEKVSYDLSKMEANV